MRQSYFDKMLRLPRYARNDNSNNDNSNNVGLMNQTPTYAMTILPMIDVLPTTAKLPTVTRNDNFFLRYCKAPLVARNNIPLNNLRKC